MSPEDLARAVADDLGPDIASVLEKQPTAEATRAFGVGETLMMAGLLLQCADFVWKNWREKRDPPALVLNVFESPKLADISPSLDTEKRLDVMSRVLAKQLPDEFGAYRPGIAEPRSIAKREWIASYLQDRGEPLLSQEGPATRDFQGGAPLLIPFADQDYWIVGRQIGWIPDADDGPDVIEVQVPKGFVTDLASVPRYLWAILAKTGRYGNAAIYHDWLYCSQPCPRAVADKVFDRAMHEMGVNAATRKSMWAAVRIFGPEYWQSYMHKKAHGAKFVLTEFPDDPRITWEEWRQRPDVFA